jgi:hypothetical protein
MVSSIRLAEVCGWYQIRGKNDGFVGQLKVRVCPVRQTVPKLHASHACRNKLTTTTEKEMLSSSVLNSSCLESDPVENYNKFLESLRRLSELKFPCLAPSEAASEQNSTETSLNDSEKAKCTSSMHARKLLPDLENYDKGLELLPPPLPSSTSDENYNVTV